MIDMPRDIWAWSWDWDCIRFPCGAWNTSPDYQGTQYINKETLIKELEDMKIPMTPKRYGRTINATIDAVIKKVRGE